MQSLFLFVSIVYNIYTNYTGSKTVTLQSDTLSFNKLLRNEIDQHKVHEQLLADTILIVYENDTISIYIKEKKIFYWQRFLDSFYHTDFIINEEKELNQFFEYFISVATLYEVKNHNEIYKIGKSKECKINYIEKLKLPPSPFSK
jgi:hypothetical protein